MAKRPKSNLVELKPRARTEADALIEFIAERKGQTDSILIVWLDRDGDCHCISNMTKQEKIACLQAQVVAAVIG